MLDGTTYWSTVFHRTEPQPTLPTSTPEVGRPASSHTTSTPSSTSLGHHPPPPQPTTSPRQRPQQQCVTTAATGIYHITCTKHSSRSFASTFPIHSKEPAGSGRVPVVNLRERARQPLFSTGSLDKESIAHSSYPWMSSLSPWMGNFFFFSFPWTGLDFFLPVEGSVSVPGRLFSAHGWLFFNCAWMASFSVNR